MSDDGTTKRPHPSGDGDGRAGVHLTKRERQILQLVADGRTSRDIADQLKISLKTVESHRHNVMGKLQLRSIAELTKYAIRNGITSL